MENVSFITKVKKFNTILFSFLGLVILGFCCWLAYFAYATNKPHTSQRNEFVIQNATDDGIKETLTLTSPSPITGTEIFISSLKSHKEYEKNYSSRRKERPSVRNILFTDMQAETTKWLFLKHDFVVPYFQLIPDTKVNEETPLAVFYRVIKKDTNNDATLSTEDKLTLAISNIDGSRYTEIFQDVDSLLGKHVINENVLAISFSQKDNSYLAYLDLESFKVTKQLLLPQINQDSP